MARVAEIYLLSNPLSPKQNETILFNSTTEQRTYMHGRTKHAYNNLSIQRQNNTIKVPSYIDDIIDCNYLMFRNTSNGKWYYCFVVGFEYINDNCTEITFKIDPLQTYQFNYTVKPCFVEREHINDDSIGANTIDEGLAIGETTLIDKEVITGMTNFRYIIATTYGTELHDDVVPKKYRGVLRNGIYSSLQMLVFDNSQIDDMVTLINDIEEKKEGAIQYIAVVPSFALSSSQVDGNIVYQSNNCPSKDITIPFSHSTIDGYIPKNNKLFCYPYNTLLISNSNGVQNLLKFENFSNRNSITFRFFGNLGANCSVKMCPRNYKNVDTNFEEALSIEGYPQCEFTTSNFKNWLYSSFMNVGANFLTTALQMYTGNVWGTIQGGINTLQNGLNTLLKSDNVKGNSSTALTSLLAKSDFKFYHQQIKYEYARALDEYFSRYGYRVNRVKTPNHTGRNSFNYIKTQNCLCHGDVPSKYLEEIQSIYDNGVVFWHDVENFGNYTIDNSII